MRKLTTCQKLCSSENNDHPPLFITTQSDSWGWRAHQSSSFSCLDVEILSVKQTIWRVCIALLTLLWHNDMNHLSVVSELNSGVNWSSVCRTLVVNCSQRSRCSSVTPDKLKSPSSEHRPFKCFCKNISIQRLWQVEKTSTGARIQVSWRLFSFHCWCFYL